MGGQHPGHPHRRAGPACSLSASAYQAGDRHARAYPRARRQAARETGLPLAIFPQVCPWTTAQVLDTDFWPEESARKCRRRDRCWTIWRGHAAADRNAKALLRPRTHPDVEEVLGACRMIVTYEAIRKLTGKHVLPPFLCATSPVRRVS